MANLANDLIETPILSVIQAVASIPKLIDVLTSSNLKIPGIQHFVFGATDVER